MDREEVKDKRAQLNAMTDQIDAAVRDKLTKQPRVVLEVVAEELHVEHQGVSNSELAAAIVKAIGANIADIRIEGE